MKRAICCGLLLSLTGCAFIKPTTRVSYGMFGLTFEDTKNNDLIIKNATYDPKDRGFTIEEASFKNNSSDVINANVQQMLAFVEQQKAANQVLLEIADAIRILSTAYGNSLGVPSNTDTPIVPPVPVIPPE